MDEKHADYMKKLNDGGKWDDDADKAMKSALDDFKANRTW